MSKNGDIVEVGPFASIPKEERIAAYLFSLLAIVVVVIAMTIAIGVTIDSGRTHEERLRYMETGVCGHDWWTTQCSRKCNICGMLVEWLAGYWANSATGKRDTWIEGRWVIVVQPTGAPTAPAEQEE